MMHEIRSKMCKELIPIPEPVIHIDHEAAPHSGRPESDMIKLFTNLTRDLIAFRAKIMGLRDPPWGHESMPKFGIYTMEFQVL